MPGVNIADLFILLASNTTSLEYAKLIVSSGEKACVKFTPCGLQIIELRGFSIIC
jgi:hypothetical protein